jgi:prophage antirepressor-like protein
VLGLANPHIAAARLDHYERASASQSTPAGRIHVALVSLCGLYSLIARARKRAVVKTFKEWIATEGAPSLPARGAGGFLRAPTAAAEGLHSTTEIAERLGVSPGLLGRRAKHLKTARHGESRPALGYNSGKPVEQWWWTAAGRDAVVREFGGPGARALRPA